MAGNLLDIIRDIRSEIYFSKKHIWIQMNTYGLIKMGISDYWINNFSDVYFSSLIEREKIFNAGENILEIKCDGEKILLPSPISGAAKFINPDIYGKKISDPKGEDWIALILANDFIKDRGNLLSSNAYESYLTKAINENSAV